MSRTRVSELFRNLKIPKSNQPHVRPNTINTAVSEQDAVLFHGYDVARWPNFNEEAAKVLVGETRERYIDSGWYQFFRTSHQVWAESCPPLNEGALLTAYSKNVFDVVNKVKRDLRPGDGTEWSTSPVAVLSAGIEQRRGIPDAALFPRSHPCGHALMVGEGKRNHVKLSDLSTTWLKNNLANESILTDESRNNELRPYLQTFAYTLRSKKGIGMLTTYDETRFFRLDLGGKCIYMSPVVFVDQVLSTSSETKPHLLQTLLYIEGLPDPSSSELGLAVLCATEKAAYKNRKSRGGKQSRSQVQNKQGGGSASGTTGNHPPTTSRTTAVYSTDGSNEIRISPEPEPDGEVTRVLAGSKEVGILGTGLTGPVTEREYEDKRVAMKAGYPFHTMKNNEEDTYSHVLNEVEMYKLLGHVQGDAVPRVVAAGHERSFFPGCMVLITEKVGMELEEKHGRLFVGGYELGPMEVRAARDKALEGLDKIHACGVVHNDARILNLRVEMKEGKVDRVWWIDFGLGWAEGHPCYGAVDFLRRDCDHASITMAFDEILSKDL